ncbi:MAG: CheR family methyltransferase [Beijerinckiaceae bacterium]
MMQSDFQFLQKFLQSRSGLDLPEQKSYLLESRLLKVLRDFQLPTLTHLVARVRAGDAALERQVIEAMTTNETLFFRDRVPFDALETLILPRLMKARAATRRLSIWCAACSAGQEPYSLAMMFEEKRELWAGWTIAIHATDLSAAMIARAQAATYTQFEVQRGLPVRYLLKYFTQDKDVWTLNAALRTRVQFKTMNLMQDFGPIGSFDIIMCRNVLIYFDLPTRRDVLNRMLPHLAGDGRLILGAPETVVGVTHEYTPDPDAHGFYIPAKNRMSALRQSA